VILTCCGAFGGRSNLLDDGFTLTHITGYVQAPPSEPYDCPA
jgi:hypothetical protein